MIAPEIAEEILALRRELHQIPEAAFQEEKTKALLMKYLRENTCLEVTDCGKWFYARYAAGNDAPPVAFRADMDAVTGKDGKPGHYCGHDGHAAALAGLGRLLTISPSSKNVLLLFQPAEETGQGAILCRKSLEELGVSEIYGFHNIPGYPAGSILLRLHTFACASTGMEITITGTPSHAAYPDAGKNPAEVIAGLILKKGEWSRIGEKGLSLVTVIGVQIGSEAYGVSPGDGILRLTVRAEFEEEFRRLVRGITEDACRAAEEAGMDCRVRLIEQFPATENSAPCIQRIRRAAENAGLPILQPEEPFRWSEDFGGYLQSIPGAMFGVGAGENCPQLHTENYEFPDSISETVLTVYKELLKL